MKIFLWSFSFFTILRGVYRIQIINLLYKMVIVMYV